MVFDRSHQPEVTQIRRAILKTLIYGDLFDYPLLSEEIVRYLSVPASSETIRRLLDDGAVDGVFDRSDGFFTLPGRTRLIPVRERRGSVARRKWAAAQRYSRWIARMPFVRMVAVTGTLAVENVEPTDDIDLFIVTAAGRLWLSRAFVILVVRAAAVAGDELCPNYFLSDRKLPFEDRNFFNARELAQMVPLYGADTYCRMRELNDWVEDYLPHAEGTPNGMPIMRLGPVERAAKQTVERLLSGRLGAFLESWEMHRKIQKFSRRAQTEGGSVAFTPDCCKGHFDHHDEIILQLYEKRLAQYGLSMERTDG
ncbi:MAG: hypothetical protein ACE5LU_00340 [Anaerolineae bacterium]